MRLCVCKHSKQDFSGELCNMYHLFNRSKIASHYNICTEVRNSVSYGATILACSLHYGLEIMKP